jgi:hydrogenase expression/formation protein HypC
MCLGIPGEVVSIRNEDGMRVGKVKFAGALRDVCLECVDAEVGDYVLVHVGMAISKLDAVEAERTYALLRELAGAEEGLP